MKKFSAALIALSFLFLLLTAGSANASASLTISTDPVASSIGPNVVPSASLVDFNALKITNNTGQNILINMIKVSRSSGTDDSLSSAALFLLPSRTQIGSNRYFSSGAAYFDNLSLIVGANSSVSVAISAAVSNAAKNGESLGLTVGAEDIWPQGSNFTVDGSLGSLTRTVVKNEADTTPPGTPSGITVTQNGTDQPALRISWTDPTDTDLARIVIYRSNSQGQMGSIFRSFERGYGITPITFFDDTNVAANNYYYYTIRAIDIAGNVSADSAQYSAILYPKGLNIFLDSSTPVTGSLVSASSSSSTLAVFKFLAASEAIDVSKIKISGSGDGRSLSRLYLLADGILVGAVDNTANVAAGASQAIDFSFLAAWNEKISIPVNSSKTITITADIPETARAGILSLVLSGATAVSSSSGGNLSVYGSGASGNFISISSIHTSEPDPSPTPEPSPVSIPEGGLIRAQDTFDVYIVKYVGDKKFKRLILSPSVFNNYGHLKWSDVKDVSQSVIDAFTTSDLVKAVDDVRVFKLYPAGDTGEKRWIKTKAAFFRMGYDSDAIYEINQFDRDSYVTGSDLE